MAPRAPLCLASRKFDYTGWHFVVVDGLAGVYEVSFLCASVLLRQLLQASSFHEGCGEPGG